MNVGDRFSLTNPVDRIRLASAPVGARFVDEFGRAYKREAVGYVMTLGSPLDQREHQSLRLYALPAV